MPFRHICSVLNRKTGLVDLAFDNQPGNDYFTIEFCATIDGSYADPVIVNQGQGATSDSVTYNPAYTGYGLGNVTRYTFVPDDVNQTDESTFWITVTIHAGPNAGATLPFPIIPPMKSSRMPFIVKATAPDESDISDSLQILFPMIAESVSIQDLDAAVGVWVGFQPEGNEIFIAPAGLVVPISIGVKSIDRIFVRGNGDVADFVLNANLNPGSWTY